MDNHKVGRFFETVYKLTTSASGEVKRHPAFITARGSEDGIVFSIVAKYFSLLAR